MLYRSGAVVNHHMRYKAVSVRQKVRTNRDNSARDSDNTQPHFTDKGPQQRLSTLDAATAARRCGQTATTPAATVRAANSAN